MEIQLLTNVKHDGETAPAGTILDASPEVAQALIGAGSACIPVVPVPPDPEAAEVIERLEGEISDLQERLDNQTDAFAALQLERDQQAAELAGIKAKLEVAEKAAKANYEDVVKLDKQLKAAEARADKADKDAKPDHPKPADKPAPADTPPADTPPAG